MGKDQGYQLHVEAPGLWRIVVRARASFGLYPVNVYVVGGPKEAYLIDSGYPTTVDAVAAALREIGSPIIHGILLTHGHVDHAGGASALRVALHAPVVASTAEAPVFGRLAVPLVPDVPLLDEDHVPLPEGHLEVLHVPGHTPGHCNFLWPERSLLFSGDNVVTETTTAIAAPEGDMRRYLESLLRLAAHRPAMIAPGHGGLIPDAVERIGEIYRHRLEREAQVLSLLGEGLSVPRAIAARIYAGQLPDEYLWLGASQVERHLHKLVEEGRVLHEPDDPPRYRLAGGDQDKTAANP